LLSPLGRSSDRERGGASVKRTMRLMGKIWRQDLRLRDSLTNSGNIFWALVALVVPFGWVFLLFRLEPVRVRVRALRNW
jgi:hypothetical protein